jgi:hypothetical protein
MVAPVADSADAWNIPKRRQIGPPRASIGDRPAPYQQLDPTGWAKVALLAQALDDHFGAARTGLADPGAGSVSLLA